MKILLDIIFAMIAVIYIYLTRKILTARLPVLIDASLRTQAQVLDRQFKGWAKAFGRYLFHLAGSWLALVLLFTAFAVLAKLSTLAVKDYFPLIPFVLCLALADLSFLLLIVAIVWPKILKFLNFIGLTGLTKEQVEKYSTKSAS